MAEHFFRRCLADRTRHGGDPCLRARPPHKGEPFERGERVAHDVEQALAVHFVEMRLVDDGGRRAVRKRLSDMRVTVGIAF